MSTRCPCFKTALPCAAVVSGARTLAVELVELRVERARALDSRTLAGHTRNALGYAMSAYCVYKSVRGPCPRRQACSCGTATQQNLLGP
jgi:hypothetical protein